MSGHVEGQRSVQVDHRTGPVSYKLSTGERVHARRLVPGRAEGDEEVPANQIPAPDSPATPSPTPIPEPVSPALQRRGSRQRRAPDRYSPDRYK